MRKPSQNLHFEDIQNLLTTFNEGSWLGRAYVPADLNPIGKNGPVPIYVENGTTFTLADAPFTVSEIINQGVSSSLANKKEFAVSLEELLINALYYNDSTDKAHLISPADLQCLKACGVTFASSLIERVIEEKAGGNPQKAEEIRKDLKQSIGEDLSNITPGSEQSEVLKKQFQEMGLWSSIWKSASVLMQRCLLNPRYCLP